MAALSDIIGSHSESHTMEDSNTSDNIEHDSKVNANTII